MVAENREISTTFPKVSLAASAILSLLNTSPMESARVDTKSIMQQDTMKAYANTHYPGLDTLKSNFYFKKLHDGGRTDTLTNESIKVRYVGRLLDGWVFDTNIADTAKKYGIYDVTNEYAALDVMYAEELDRMVEDNSLVKGFCMALMEMNYGDKAFTMFYSEYGYSSSGSDQIGPYQPLIFWLYVEHRLRSA